jgi:arylsulfatase A-like enzyme
VVALLVVGTAACQRTELPPAPSSQRIERVVRLAPRLSEAHIEEAGAAPPRTAHTRLQGTTLRSIFQHPDSSLVFPSLLIPERATLEFAIGIDDAAVEKGSDGVGFEVLVEAGGARESVFERVLDPAKGEGERGWVRAAVSLAPWAGETVNLVLRTHRGPNGDASFDWSHWGDPGLRSLVGSSEESERPNLLLVSFDTLRADYLGTYGFPLDTSPNIDALGERGAVFENVIVQAPWTLPSHFSLLTGLYPDRRLLRYDLQPCTIDNEVTMLAEVLEQQDYLTAAFTGGGYVSSSLGFDQGFGTFESHGSRLEDNLPEVLSWIREHSSSRFFLFLHQFNTHRPYDPSPEHLERFVPEVPKPCQGVFFSDGDLRSGRNAPCLEHPSGVEYLRGLYAAEVAYADALFGRVMGALERSGALAKTLVVVTSDHGEELMDHGSLDHVRTLYQEAVSAPLVMAGPGVPPGVRVRGLVEGVDLSPTLLDLLALDHTRPRDGESRAALLACSGADASPSCAGAAPVAFAATAFDRGLSNLEGEPHDFKAAAISRDGKLLAQGAGSPSEEWFFDLAEDPRELHARPTPSTWPPGARTLRTALGTWLAELPEDRYCKGGAAVSPELRHELEALGYLR